VLTNLDNPSGRRHPVYLARAIAGILRPELAPPETLTPRVDPSPEVTRGIAALLSQLASDREPELATPAFKQEWASSPGRRAIRRRQLEGIGSVEFLGRDDIANRPQWGAEPLARLVYYKVAARNRTHYITVGLTKEGKVGRLDIPFQPSP